MRHRSSDLAVRDRGDTLVEVLVAVVIIGLTATAVLGGFATSIASSAEHRQITNIDTALRSYASAATYELQQQPNPTFTQCATSSSYQIASAYPANASAGSQIEVFGTGFTANASVTIKIGSTNVTADIVTGTKASSTGTVSAVVDLPATGLATGANALTVATGSASATGTFTVTTGTTVSTNLSGYSIALATPRYWNGTSFVSTCTQSGNSPQLLTATATSPGAATDSLSFVVINPEFFSSSGPVFDSLASAAFTVGAAGSFTVRASGQPTPALSETGALPSGVTFVDNHNGTATLAGTPASGTSGTYAITLTANNGVLPNASQLFTLTVQGPPTITSAATTTFTNGTLGSFTVTSSSIPTATLSETGSLPPGVTFADNGNGTATLSGTPTGASSGPYVFTITANNGINPNATQTFTLNVNKAPAITSAATTTFTVGSPGSFTVTTSGYPSATITESGSLPSNVQLMDNGNGTATLSGTPQANTSGTYTITITANNGVAPNATQSFTLVVNGPPRFTSATSDTFTVNASNSFQVTTAGSPTATITYVVTTGTIPPWLTVGPSVGGTITLSGDPPKKTPAGSVVLTFTASNGIAPNATQVFTLSW